jgi:hypothetical protein
MALSEENQFQAILLIIVIIFLSVTFLFRESFAYAIARGELATASRQYDSFIAPYVVNCSVEQNEAQVRCVVDALRPIMKYNGTEKFLAILSSKKYFERGGTCKEIAIIYTSAFRQLNWTKVEFRSPVPKHMSITIAKAIDNTTWVYCDVELNRENCNRVENELW